MQDKQHPKDYAAIGSELPFSAKLRRWQERRKLTDAQAAAGLGVPTRTYNNWVQGHREPRGLAYWTILRIISNPNP